MRFLFLFSALFLGVASQAFAKYVPLVYHNEELKIVPLVQKFGEARKTFKKAQLHYVADKSADKRGWIGVEIQNLTKEKATSLGLSKPVGIFVINVTKFAPAEKGGIQSNDVILSFDGKGFKDMRSFVDIVEKTAVGSEVPVKVWRQQREETLTVKVGSYQTQVDVRRQSAEAGNIKDMMQLGFMYRDGNVVTQNDDEAFKWFKQASDLGDTRGMTNVAYMYEKGRGTAKDEAEAYSFYSKAAVKGSAYSMNKVAVMLENGRGTAKNRVEAVKWYRKAAEAGYAIAMNNLGLMFEKGRGTRMNYQQAAFWYSKGANGGSTTAMYNLAYLYNKGRGVERDPVLGAEWMYKAIKAKYQFSVEEMTTNHHKWSEAFLRELQRLMKKDGHFKGRVDGTFENDSIAAIEKLGGAK